MIPKSLLTYALLTYSNDLLSPLDGWLHKRRRWCILANDLEHLPDEPLECPVAHHDTSARTAYADEFCGSQFRAWGKHDADQRHHQVKCIVLIRQCFSIANVKADGFFS